MWAEVQTSSRCLHWELGRRKTHPRPIQRNTDENPRNPRILCGYPSRKAFRVYLEGGKTEEIREQSSRHDPSGSPPLLDPPDVGGRHGGPSRDRLGHIYNCRRWISK